MVKTMSSRARPVWQCPPSPTSERQSRIGMTGMQKKLSICNDTSGNFGLIFGLLAVPVMLAGGLAVDYVGLSLERSELQNAVDAAALAVAREGNIPEEQAVQIA